VIRPDLRFRGYAGRIESGRIREGDRVTVLPSGKRSSVKRIATFDGDLEEAFAPMAVTLVLEDELDISRGDWICGENDHPVAAPQIEAMLVWMQERPLEPGATLLLQQGATRVQARVSEIVHKIDPETYGEQQASQLALNEIGLVRLEAARALVFDRYRDNRHTGSFVLIDRINNLTLGAGMVERAVVAGPNVDDDAACEFSAAPVTATERSQRYGHRPAVVISRSHDLRRALERALFARGAAVAVLEARPPGPQIQDLLANGMILVTPPAPADDPASAAWIESAEAASTEESVRETLRDLERRGVLLSRRFREVTDGD
jgi:hypothetical protein